MEEENHKNLFGTIFLVVGVIIMIVISGLIVQSFLDSPSLDCVDTNDGLSSNQSILTESTATLSPVEDGINSSSIVSNNDTWLEFDGVGNVIISERFDTISFWYKNTTTDWTFVVNSSGTLYVDGVLGTPGIYPVYDDGVNMFIGKIDGSTFINVSIDDFRGYGAEIESSLVNLTYQDGRQ